MLSATGRSAIHLWISKFQKAFMILRIGSLEKSAQASTQGEIRFCS